MGCDWSKQQDSGESAETLIEQKKDFVVKPTAGPPSSLYPFIMENGKPKELGTGAFSIVFEATDKRTKQMVAVKRITKANLRPHDHDALKNEVAILNECKGQANILAFVDFFDEKDYYHLVTEQINGGELFDRICDKELYNEQDARQLAKVLISILACLHGKSIAHRDIKPENLLLKSATSDTQIVLADFGFATKCNGKDLNQVCGTPDYVAPEIITHTPYDLKCDVWSAGVIAYILLCGYAPFQARNANDREELFKVIKRGKLVFHERYWKDVSDDAKDAISQMLNVDPDARPSAVDLLRHPWIANQTPLNSSQSQSHSCDLSESKARLKDFNAKRKLKGAVNTIMATNKVRRALSAMKASQEADQEAGAAPSNEGEAYP